MTMIKRGKKKMAARHRFKSLSLAGHPQTESEWNRLKRRIDKRYPAGRFVAVENGEFLADGATFREVHDTLNAMGKTSRSIAVIQAGVPFDPPATIIL